MSFYEPENYEELKELLLFRRKQYGPLGIRSNCFTDIPKAIAIIDRMASGQMSKQDWNDLYKNLDLWDAKPELIRFLNQYGPRLHFNFGVHQKRSKNYADVLAGKWPVDSIIIDYSVYGFPVSKIEELFPSALIGVQDDRVVVTIFNGQDVLWTEKDGSWENNQGRTVINLLSLVNEGLIADQLVVNSGIGKPFGKPDIPFNDVAEPEIVTLDYNFDQLKSFNSELAVLLHALKAYRKTYEGFAAAKWESYDQINRAVEIAERLTAGTNTENDWDYLHLFKWLTPSDGEALKKAKQTVRVFIRDHGPRIRFICDPDNIIVCETLAEVNAFDGHVHKIVIDTPQPITHEKSSKFPKPVLRREERRHILTIPTGALELHQLRVWQTQDKDLPVSHENTSRLLDRVSAEGLVDYETAYNTGAFNNADVYPPTKKPAQLNLLDLARSP